MKGLCPSCGRVHDSSWTRAVGRFDPSITTTYRAAHAHSDIRPTRADAEADMCAHLKERK